MNYNKANCSLKHFWVWGLCFLFVSCDSQIKILEHIDRTRPFTLTVRQPITGTSLINLNQTVINANSDKYNQLTNWANKNDEGWNSTPASYYTEIGVSQDDFHLLYYREGSVVISFVNKEGAQQYRKEIKPGELDFLLK